MPQSENVVARVTASIAETSGSGPLVVDPPAVGASLVDLARRLDLQDPVTRRSSSG